ncbi:MAG: hypothetical protein FGM16_00650 [Flavobacterium sp.]|nr:hypothetical protein [Flavobacterium sp.]
MKKILALALVAISLQSCTEDIQFNDKSVFQCVKDNQAWKGGDAVATFYADGKFTIEGFKLNESMSLTVPKPTTLIDPNFPNTYVRHTFGTTLNRTASYSYIINTVETNYTTGIGIGNGEIEITEYDGEYVSGNFRFNAVNPDATSEEPDNVNVQGGYFYKVKIVDGL